MVQPVAASVTGLPLYQRTHLSYYRSLIIPGLRAKAEYVPSPVDMGHGAMPREPIDFSEVKILHRTQTGSQLDALA